jgi:hypothetical protein
MLQKFSQFDGSAVIADVDTDWVQCVFHSQFDSFNKAHVFCSWNSAAGGAFDGNFDIYTSDDNTAVLTDLAPVANIALNAETSVVSIDNSILIDFPFNYIRVVYTKNSVTTAKITITVKTDK